MNNFISEKLLIDFFQNCPYLTKGLLNFCEENNIVLNKNPIEDLELLQNHLNTVIKNKCSSEDISIYCKEFNFNLGLLFLAIDDILVKEILCKSLLNIYLPKFLKGKDKNLFHKKKSLIIEIINKEIISDENEKLMIDIQKNVLNITVDFFKKNKAAFLSLDIKDICFFIQKLFDFKQYYNLRSFFETFRFFNDHQHIKKLFKNKKEFYFFLFEYTNIYKCPDTNFEELLDFKEKIFSNSTVEIIPNTSNLKININSKDIFNLNYHFSNNIFFNEDGKKRLLFSVQTYDFSKSEIYYYCEKSYIDSSFTNPLYQNDIHIHTYPFFEYIEISTIGLDYILQKYKIQESFIRDLPLELNYFVENMCLYFTYCFLNCIHNNGYFESSSESLQYFMFIKNEFDSMKKSSARADALNQKLDNKNDVSIHVRKKI